MLSEQLDAMLMRWLERRADERGPGRPDLRAKAVMAIAERALPEIERFCAAWAMTVEHDGGVAVIEGPALVVEGFAEIARTRY
jgi:hypothetical protein